MKTVSFLRHVLEYIAPYSGQLVGEKEAVQRLGGQAQAFAQILKGGSPILMTPLERDRPKALTILVGLAAWALMLAKTWPGDHEPEDPDQTNTLVLSSPIRHQLAWFVGWMENRLASKDAQFDKEFGNRNTWEDIDIDTLYEQACANIDALGDHIDNQDKEFITKKAIDAANFCMMIADVTRRNR